MNNGSLPIRLVFLSDLPTQALGSKVRFLGCVSRYTLATGVLEVQHAYHPPPKAPTIALVDVNVILENLKREDTEVGAWINIVGYVKEVLRDGRIRQAQAQEQMGVVKREGDRVREGTRAVRVKVQAILLWSAGGVKIGEYEGILGERLESENEAHKAAA